MLKFFSPLITFFLCWILLLFTDFAEISIINGLIQIALFIPLACLPGWKTGRMSYVDIAWPAGLMAIGINILIFMDGDHWRKLVIAAVYLLIGLRMLVKALKMWARGDFEEEFARYKYQRRRWERAGLTNTSLALQIEVIVQALVNATFLAIPGFLMAANDNPNLSVIEAVGLGLWLAAYLMEFTADAQKIAFLKDMKEKGLENQVCNVGLWRYSRHPNYFAEWSVWTALVIAALPSLFALYGETHIIIWALLGLCLINVSIAMYDSLVKHTGAKPSEFYSVQKRPGYKDYQKTTNMFFPGPVKKVTEG